jgi:predicted nucleotidyltransferase
VCDKNGDTSSAILKALQLKKVIEFIKQLNIDNILVFGSVLRDKFNPF